MNDIEILEEMLKDYKNRIEHEYGFSDYFIQKNKKEKQAIENLINKVKELEKENREIRDWKYVIDSYEDLDKIKELDLIKIKGKEYISKDKIKEKIEELEEGYIEEVGLDIDAMSHNQFIVDCVEILEELKKEEG